MRKRQLQHNTCAIGADAFQNGRPVFFAAPSVERLYVFMWLVLNLLMACHWNIRTHLISLPLLRWISIILRLRQENVVPFSDLIEQKNNLNQNSSMNNNSICWALIIFFPIISNKMSIDK